MGTQDQETDDQPDRLRVGEVDGVSQSEALFHEHRRVVGIDVEDAELNAAGVLVSEGALQPSSKGLRYRTGGNDAPTITDGPFTEAKELVAGYWLWQVRSLDEDINVAVLGFAQGVRIEF